MSFVTSKKSERCPVCCSSVNLVFFMVPSLAGRVPFPKSSVDRRMPSGLLDCSAPLNRFGELAGYSIDSHNVVHGFLRSRDGKVKTFDAPPDAGNQGFGCLADCTLGLSDRGAITRSYLDTKNVYHGFLRKQTGKMITFDAPRADTTAGSSHGTFPVSINNEGAITGHFLDANSVYHGFVRLPSEDDD